MIARRQILHALMLGALGAACRAPAWAQPASGAFPTKPVRIIVPLPPGSPPDVLARLVAEGLSRHWSQPILVENRPGATGMIGMQAVAKAEPDGHTVGILFLTHTVLPQLIEAMPYDTARDLAPVANLVWLYNVLVVPADSPIQSMDQLLTSADAKDGKRTYGSGGNGSPAHLLGESFARAVKANVLHVPFKGPSEAMTSLMGNQVDFMFATAPVAAPLVRSGRLRALAVTSPERLASLPDVPTLAERGLRGLELREWEGVVAPAGTPASVIDAWNAALMTLIADPSVRARLLDLGMTTAEPNRPAQFAALIQQELEHWQQFAKVSPLKVG
ncbi:tripartite tricarboxylate transporter substrate binding protein [Achromobacter sp. GG226]|uniref:Bug family tripartite tricarboxylate transporter substrate binding protein n=1 Tax=Verticiella alkaliphila TaxID=2779529 RepID=UPI001C0B13E8|nr:tripartite tricarboxylate transporter substrate binding protein [Verticiella sp. GG226]MBU4611771.1 tripartite tricarboxylate transporter substrate binding protein [Verticiella sp. GG226]